MIVLHQMAQFVDNYIVGNRFRCLHQQAVEIEIALAAAAAPAAALMADGNAAVLQAQLLRPICCTPGKEILCPDGEVSQFFLGERRCRWR